MEKIVVYLHSTENPKIVGDFLPNLILVGPDKSYVLLPQISSGPSHVVLVLKKKCFTKNIKKYFSLFFIPTNQILEGPDRQKIYDIYVTRAHSREQLNKNLDCVLEKHKNTRVPKI